MSRSRIAIVTLITASVLGSFYYKRRQNNSVYDNFVDSLPITVEDDFLSRLFQNASDIVPSTLEDIKEKMRLLYPAFERQLESLQKMYSSFWDYLFLEDFKKIVKESLEEDDDVMLHPEIEQDAQVREGQDLSDSERQFIKNRKEKIKAAFAFFIGVEEHEVEVEDIPNIGIASRRINCDGRFLGFFK
ncbi:hypothetical protein G6F56_008531 [Rhizopus delemar]|nr:hypothetical protein G6F56_008531 [Rhizopus delemar]